MEKTKLNDLTVDCLLRSMDDNEVVKILFDECLYLREELKELLEEKSKVLRELEAVVMTSEKLYKEEKRRADKLEERINAANALANDEFECGPIPGTDESAPRGTFSSGDVSCGCIVKIPRNG